MKSYKYVARDLTGSQKRGIAQADSSTDVISYLQGQGLTPISIDEISTGASKSRRVTRHKRIKSADLASLCWQLSTMIEGGIPLTVVLDTIAEDAEHSDLGPILRS
ncbi:unnamed protein product, partial [marine sediment metagenome]